MNIRKATEEDSPELISLIQLADNRTEEAASKKVRKIMRSKEGSFIVAMEKNKLIGYLLFIATEPDKNAQRFLNTGKYSCICWIAVHPEYRDRQIGSKLLKEAEKYASQNNKEGLWLDCREKVINFYKKNGFDVVGVYKRETSSRILKDCFVMTKKIW